MNEEKEEYRNLVKITKKFPPLGVYNKNSFIDISYSFSEINEKIDKWLEEDEVISVYLRPVDKEGNFLEGSTEALHYEDKYLNESEEILNHPEDIKESIDYLFNEPLETLDEELLRTHNITLEEAKKDQLERKPNCLISPDKVKKERVKKITPR